VIVVSFVAGIFGWMCLITCCGCIYRHALEKIFDREEYEARIKMNKVRKLKDKEDMEIMERMYLEEHGPPIERNKKK